MGLHDYDAWRLTPPWDMPRRRARFAPATVTRPLCIEAGEITIDATGTYEADTGALVTVTINGVDHPVHEVLAMLATFARGECGSWDDDLDEGELARLCGEAARDAEADWGDYQRDMREDL